MAFENCTHSGSPREGSGATEAGQTENPDISDGRQQRLPRLAGERSFVTRFGRRKGSLLPIQECEKDKTGGFTKSGPVDSQRRFPRFFCLSCNYGHIPGSALPIGEIGSGRERPPCFASRIGTVVWRNFHLRDTPWEGRSRPKYPCGKATAKIPEDLLWPSKVFIPPT